LMNMVMVIMYAHSLLDAEPALVIDSQSSSTKGEMQPI
jgi:hypothetical protein